MSLPKVDFRTKVAVDDDFWLEAIAKARGCEKSKVGRDFIAAGIREYKRAASIANDLLEREGLTGLQQGGSGRNR